MNYVNPGLRRPERQTAAAATGSIVLDAGRQRILADLLAHLRTGSGPMVLLGEPGSGRTTMLVQLAQTAAAERLTLLLPSTEADPSASLRAVVERLETWPAAAPTLSAVAAPPAGIVIDDAEACPVAVWHKLADLLRARRNASAMPPIVLALPSPMLQWLKDLALVEPEALEGRIRRLAPLAAPDAARLVEQRLQTAGLVPPPHFPDETVERLVAATGGLPGPLNLLCDALLAMAGVRGRDRVPIEMIDAAIAGSGGAAAGTVPPPESTQSLEPVQTAAAAADRPGVAVVQPPAVVRAAAEPPSRSAPAAGAWDDRLRLHSPEADHDHRDGTLYRRRRRRRRRIWPWIVGAGVVATLAGLMVILSVYRPSPDGTLSAVPTERGATPSVQPWTERTAPAPMLTADPAPSAAPSATDPSLPLPTAMIGEPPPSSPAEITTAVGGRVSAGNAAQPPAFLPAPVERPASPSPTPSAAKPRETPAKKPQTQAETRSSASARKAEAGKRPTPPAGQVAAVTNAEAGEQQRSAEANGGAAEAEQPGPPRPVGEIIAKGDEFREAGDVPWARKYYTAARERGSATAMRSLAETFDPRYAAASNADPARARDLYDEAARKGDRDAAKARDTLDQWLDEGR